MRGPAIAVVFTLLLPAIFPSGGRSGDGGSPPLAFLGGGSELTDWEPPAVITEVYYNALRADEYVVISGPAATPSLDVSGWTISDGEGTLTFPPNSAVGGGTVVAQNATAYFEDALRAADFQYRDGNATPMMATGTFQLNNGGDEVVLRDAGGTVVDVFVYGVSSYSGAGWTGPTADAVDQGYVATRARVGTWQDTNSSADWDLLRIRSLGQSALPSVAYAPFTAEVRAFVTPDARADPLFDLIETSTSSIAASLYTLTSPTLGTAMEQAAARGVRIRVLLEGAPVGGIDRDEWTVVQRLAAAGAEVHFMIDDTKRDIQERYRFLHAKYAVVDARWVLVTTENWGDSAFPDGPITGSRGWGAAIDDPPLAAFFGSVFSEDFDDRRRDIATFAEMSVTPVEPRPEPATPRDPRFPSRSAFESDLTVTPIVGPDTSLAILDALRGASRSIHVEVFYAHTTWGPFPNLFLEEILDAARRGVSVRILLDASPYNTDEGDPTDNDDTVAVLTAVAESEGFDLRAKLIDLGAHELTRMHTKGFVVDGEWTLISSINWNRNSVTANREAGLLVRSAGVAEYFEDVFAWDWRDDFTPPVADAGPDRAVDEGVLVAFSGLGSHDDVGVVNWSWDLDGDGAFDAWGAEVEATFLAPGTVTVRLRAADAENNTDEDAATVEVRGALAPAPIPLAPLVATLVVPAAFALLAIALRRRRQRLSKPP